MPTTATRRYEILHDFMKTYIIEVENFDAGENLLTDELLLV